MIAKTGYINPGATGPIPLTRAVAMAGANPLDIHIPILKPRDADVIRIFAGKVSTKKVGNGPQYKLSSKAMKSNANWL